MRYVTVTLLALLAASVALNFYFVAESVNQNALVVWNVPEVVKPNQYLFSTMFDTFRMNIYIRANSTIYVYVFTPSQYSQFYESGGSVRNSVQSYSGETIKFTFNLSVGCAGYVWVVYNPSNSPVIVHPYVTAVYSPSKGATGVCSET